MVCGEIVTLPKNVSSEIKSTKTNVWWNILHVMLRWPLQAEVRPVTLDARFTFGLYFVIFKYSILLLLHFKIIYIFLFNAHNRTVNVSHSTLVLTYFCLKVIESYCRSLIFSTVLLFFYSLISFQSTIGIRSYEKYVRLQRKWKSEYCLHMNLFSAV